MKFKQLDFQLLSSMFSHRDRRPAAPAPPPPGGSKPSTAHPFFIVAHRVNSLNALAAALAAGATGLEIDVNVTRHEPAQLRVDHGSILTGGYAAPTAPTLATFVRSLRALAQQRPFSLAYFDCKPRVASPQVWPQLLNVIHKELTGHPDTPSGLRVLISFPKVYCLRQLGSRIHDLHPEALLMVDEELDYAKVRDCFRELGVARYAYGNGSSVAQRIFSKLAPRGRHSLAAACQDRDADNGPLLVGVCTVNDESELRTYLGLGVNMIMTDLHPPCYCPGAGLTALRRIVGEKNPLA